MSKFHRRTPASRVATFAPWIALAVLVVAIVVVMQIPQRADIVPLGQTQTLAISKTGAETAAVTVDLERRGDVYLIRYAVDPAMRTVDRYWRLVDSTGTEHAPSLAARTPDCLTGECAAVAVPDGTEITMVRWYGVDRRALRYTQFFQEEWAGWTL